MMMMLMMRERRKAKMSRAKVMTAWEALMAALVVGLAQALRPLALLAPWLSGAAEVEASWLQ